MVRKAGEDLVLRSVSAGGELMLKQYLIRNLEIFLLKEEN